MVLLSNLELDKTIYEQQERTNTVTDDRWRFYLGMYTTYEDHLKWDLSNMSNISASSREAPTDTRTPIPIHDISNMAIKKIVERVISENIHVFQMMINSEIEQKFRSLTTDISIHDVNDSKNMRLHGAAVLKATIRESFIDMDFVKQVFYADRDEWLKLIVIHENDDLVYAFSAIDDRIVELEKSTPGLNIEPLILHISEVESHDMIGAKTIFER